MKNIYEIHALKKYFQQLVVSAALFLIILVPSQLFAQTDSTKTDSTKQEEPVAEEESALISPSVLFTTTQKGNNTIDLKAVLNAKVKGTFYKTPLLKITFLQITEAEEKVLGFVITDRNGIAVLNANADSLKTDKEGKLHFKAVFAGNKSMDPVEEEVTIKRALLEIIPVKEDSVLSVQVRLIDLGTGVKVPVPETLLGIFVHRSFYPLKVGEGTTDENGEASVEISNDLPGDMNGNIILMAKLDENEVYGNMESSVTQKWGTPVSDKIKELPRALWGAHPPLWMVFTFIILMTAVWGHYIVIIYELIRLRKEEPHPPANPIV